MKNGEFIEGMQFTMPNKNQNTKIKLKETKQKQSLCDAANDYL